jgi:serine protease Do
MKILQNPIPALRMHRHVGIWTVLAAAAIFIILFAVPPACSRTETSQPTPMVQMAPLSFTDLADASSPAVVNIRTVKTLKSGGRVYRHFFGGPNRPNDPFQDFFKKFFDDNNPGQFRQDSLGSGFIFDAEGYIVTNNHVIADADEIQVKLKNGVEFDAEIIGSDSSTDLALIKIKPDQDLPALTLGDSDQLKVGQWVIAIGNPFGLEHTVTAGIVSAKGRLIGAGPYDDFIQTDASINPGNSGGPLINMNGEVVGINTAIVAGGDGIGFAIPINMAKSVINQLKETGEVSRGWLGVAIQDLDAELKRYYGVENGVLIAEVFPGDPAEKAGIKPKDIVISVNGAPVDASRDLSRRIADIPEDGTAELEINRGGKTMKIKVKVAKRDDSRTAMQPGDRTVLPADTFGIRVADITPEIAEQFQIRDTEGAVVMDVASGSTADQAGFATGDLIREINHKPVKNAKDYQAVIDKAKKGDTLEFLVKRAFKGYLVIKLTR